MASLCKRQQCIIERRGIRQDLDSWRYKLIQCVGFESILEGLFGSRLIEDLRLYKDCQPEGVSDWSFDENCLFCCLRREKVKEHLLGLNNDSLGSVARPLSFIKDQFNISNLEREAEEFLNAVLHRKDIPSFSDPDIPVVAREIMQRMIRQFAAEYTSKTSSAQGAPAQPNGTSDQSLLTTQPHTPTPAPAPAPAPSPSPSPAAPSPAGLTPARNPVLSQLLMAEQDAPLDLTVKKPDVIVCEQDGVLDLSTKKNRNRGTVSVRASAPLVKGDPHHPGLANARDQQSTSAIEQFMDKLCLHHRSQIVDALGYLETEVKAVASTSVPQVAPDERTPGSCGLALCQERSEIQHSERMLALSSKARCKPELMETATRGSLKKVVLGKDSYHPGSRDASGSSLLDLRKDMTEGRNILSCLLTSSHEYEPLSRQYQSHHEPSSTKSGQKSLAKDKMSSAHHLSSGTLEQQCASNTELQCTTSSKDDDVIVLSPSYDRHESSEPQQHSNQGFPGHAKDISTRSPLVLNPSNVVSPNTPRTARKSRHGSFPRTKDGSVCRIDPDIHCDIVFIGKSITECQSESLNRMHPRRNARKSIRGHKSTEDYLELRTVRTLARKSAENGSGNCPAPMPVITLVTPKQALAKPDGVPPVDMPFAGGIGESILQSTPTETLAESEMLGDVLTNVNDVDVIVETSQTGQTSCLDKVDTCPEISATVATQKGTMSEQDEVLCPAEPLSQQTTELPTRDDHDEALMIESAEKTEPVLERTNEDLQCEQSPRPLSVSGETGIEEPCIRNESPSLAQEVDINLKGNETNVESIHQNIDADISAEVGGDTEISALEEQPSVDITQNDVLHEQPGIETEFNTVHPSCETEKEVVDEPSSECTQSDAPPESDLEKEAVVREVLSSPESKKPKKRRNVRTFGSSDRQLRSRASGVEDLPTTPEKNDQTASAQVFDCVTEEPKTPETKRPLRSVKAKESDVCNSEVQQGEAVCKEQTQQPNIDKLDKTADSEDQTADSKDQTTDSEDQTADSEDQTADSEDQTADSKDQTTDSEDKTTDSEDKTTDSEDKTTDSKDKTADSSPCETPVADHVVHTRKMLRSTPARQTLDQDREQKGEPTVSNVTDAHNPATTELKEKESLELTDKSEQTTLEVSHAQDPPSLTEPPVTQSDPSVVTSPSRVSTRMPLRNRSGTVESNQHQPTPKPSTEKSGHMPLRSANTVVAEETAADSPSTSTSSVEEKSRHMPLRSRSHAVDNDTGSSTAGHAENAGRMPLRSSNASTSSQPMSPVMSGKDKKAQKSPKPSKPATLSSDSEHSLTGSPLKPRTDKSKQSQVKEPVIPIILPSIPNPEPTVPNPHKFMEALRGEENQQLILNLNNKFDKMQKGWVQVDKEGPPVQRSRNKADRLKDIWKSKKRVRKPRPLEPHRFSPVQMLFMKSFDLPSICRWFLQTTETKSLVIVKKLNTRLPSETQLTFHSSSSLAGSSHGVSPSVQAERLKKHLKKFAIASPVKSNAKSQKLIAETLEQEPVSLKGKEKLTSAIRMSTKPQVPPSHRGVAQSTDSQKTSSIVKNPATRILRKYKMQEQQKSRNLKDQKVERHKGPSKQKASSANQEKKSGGKDTNIPKKENAPQSGLNKRSTARPSKEKVTKAASVKALKEPAVKDGPAPKRSQQTPVSPRTQRSTVAATASPKGNVNKKENAAEKRTGEKSLQSPPSESKADARKPVAVKAPTSLVSPTQSPEPSVSQDQVLTRSQRKIEAAQRLSESPKSSTKRALEPVVTPVKRTRTSLSKTN